MPIKQILLQGISRTPSDRMISDGGVAESVNAQMENSEVVPVLKPVVLKSVSSGEFIYLHKTARYSNKILVDGNKLYAFHNDETERKDMGVTFAAGETITSVTSLGNTLVLATSKSMYYLLYMDGKYTNLGGSVPFPNMLVKPTVYVRPTQRLEFQGDLDNNSAYWFALGTWNYENPVVLDSDIFAEGYVKAKEMAMDIRSFADHYCRYWELYSAPVNVVYTLVLYDGTEIASEPFYVSGRKDPRCLQVKGRATENGDGTNREASVDIDFHNLFSMSLFKKDNSVEVLKEKWSDVVKAVRVYVSEDIYPDVPKTYSNAMVDNRTEVPVRTGIKVDCDIILYEPKLTEKNILSRSQFYLTNEFTLDELLDVPARQIDYYHNNDRVTKKLLQTSTALNNRNIIRGKNLLAYNNRLVLSDITTTMSKGAANYSASFSSNMYLVNTSIQLYYYIHTSQGDSICVRGNDWYNDAADPIALNPGSLIIYPNADCYKAIIRFSTEAYTDWFEIPMKAHPYLPNYSYFYSADDLSLMVLLEDVAAGNPHDGITYLGEDFTPPATQTEEHSPNKMYQSVVNNFYVMEESLTFMDEIVSVATTTKALSTGQYGAFPLYVFTRGGIYSVSLDETGALKAMAPLSRDVALDGTVCPIDQAIVFSTDKGVMLLQGSDIACVSEFMNGEHYSLEQPVIDLLTQKRPDMPYQANIYDEGFMEFMKTAKASYDYANNRIVYFNKEKPFQYALMLETSSWHKLYARIDSYETMQANPLNSYPDALVSVHIGDESAIVDFSNAYNAARTANDESLETLIVTRPLDLDAPDVLKTINHLRIRGRYEKVRIYVNSEANYSAEEFEDILTQVNEEHEFTWDELQRLANHERITHEITAERIAEINSKVQGMGDDLELVQSSAPTVSYILLASQDGYKWWRLGSLRGKSWKMFRIVILADLKPTERISWLEIDYETRFTNKPR